MATLQRYTKLPAAATCALVAAATLIASCGDDTGSTDRAGGQERVTLRIGSPDVPGRPGADQVEELARQVEELSGGSLVIEPSWGPEPGRGVDDWDQLAAQRVIDGEVELGLIPARAWDVLGVETLRALNAPFLIPSEVALADVLHDEVTTDLLSGLDEVGVEGLALFPEGMRRLFLVGESRELTELEDRVVRAPRSETVYAFFEALGATADDFSDDPVAEDAAIEAGSLVAFESSFVGAPTIGLPTIAVGNVALFPEVNALVANADALDELSDAHRAVLDDAAAATLAWSIDQVPSEAEAAEQYCADGGRIVVDDSATTALDHAAATVLDLLDDDPATAAVIERIASITSSTTRPESLEACDGSGTGGSVTSDGAFPEGVYRADITLEALLAGGVNRTDAINHAGVWTLAFEGGELTASDVNAATGVTSEGTGVYCIEGGRIVLGLLESPPRCGDFWNAAWEVDGDELRFVDVVSDHGAQLLISELFGGTPFTRIG